MEAQGTMQCPACGHENRDGAKFCEECAAPVTRRCGGCGATLRPTAKFCDECGAPTAPVQGRDPRAYTPKHLADKILGSKSALEGERKQVTVLFADVKGSMDLAEQVDAEAWHRIMDRFFTILAEGVHRFEGTVNQYTGDGIMALFGAPIAHEDHAQRACWAALHLADELRGYAQELKRERGLGFSVRMGLNSGEVIVGKIGDDLRMDYTAQGQTVGLAARMEQLASPDTIYLTERTAALVSGYFDLLNLERFHVKGVREPIGVYQLRGVGRLRTRLEMSRARGFSRFVGRSDEMATLQAALDRAVAGQGQVVGVVAEAGIGKSRLCFEFAERCRARGIAVYEAQAVAHGKAIPLLPVLELWRRSFGITEHDSDRAARDKIAGRMVLLDPQLADALAFMFEFLGVPDPERPAPRIEPEAWLRQIAEVMRRLVRARSQREQAAVHVLEDLHWLDAASELFVATLVESAPGGRTLVLLNFRPEYRALWMQKSWYQQLPLQPLGPEATEQLLADLLGSDPSVQGLTALVRERTGGNPFFIEEVVHALFAEGALARPAGTPVLIRPVAEIHIPATVQTVLAARIDRLPERAKQVLQTAAVIGKTFAEPILRRVAADGEPALSPPELGAALRSLTQAEFLYEEALYPEVEYAFKHPLTQEVAYGSQLGARRRRVHAAVARAVEDLDPHKLDERAALLAHHWELADDAARAADWHRRAAEWAGANHTAEAFLHWRRVRELLDTLPPSAATAADGATARAHLIQLAFRLGGWSRDEVAVLIPEARALAERSGDVCVLALVLLSAGFFTAVTGAPLDGVPLLEEAMQRADESGDTGLRVAARFYLHIVYGAVGRLTEAVARGDEGIALGEPDPDAGTDILGYSSYRILVGWQGWMLSLAGRLQQAAREVERGVALAQESGQWVPGSIAHGNYVTFCDFSGETHAALAHGRASVELAERSGSEVQRVMAFAALGLAHVLNDQAREGLENLTQALSIARQRGIALIFEAQYLGWLARAQLGLGEWAAARATAEEAIDVARRRGTRLFAIEPYVVLVRALIQSAAEDRRGDIDAALTAAFQLAEETGARGYLPFIHHERAELARLLGDEASRQRELREAHRLFTEMGATARAERVV